MLSARADRFAPLEHNTQAQFGGLSFGVGGLSIPALGSTGFLGGIRGGIIPGGAFQGAGGSGIGSVIDLEAAFGVGFTAANIRDAIRKAEQEARLEALKPEGTPFQTVIDVATGPAGRLVLNVLSGLFEFLDPTTGRKLSGGVTPEAALEGLVSGGAGGVGGIPDFPVTAFQEPSPLPGPSGGGDFNALLRTILGALGQLRARPTVRGLEPVGIGGSVNVPVVRGSTADPTGTFRPTPTAFGPRPPPPPAPPPPPSTQARNIALQAVVDLLLRLRAERALKEAQRRAEQLQAQQLATLRALVAAQTERRAAIMPFGQSGFSAGGGGVGGGFDTLASVVSALAPIARDIFAPPPRDLRDIAPGGGIIQQPVGLPAALLRQVPGTLAGLGLGELFGGGDACPALFRGGAVRTRPASVVCVPDPATGEARFFGHLGKPLLFSRDISAAKKVRKLAQRFARKG